jgi:hypothetical protein
MALFWYLWKSLHVGNLIFAAHVIIHLVLHSKPGVAIKYTIIPCVAIKYTIILSACFSVFLTHKMKMCVLKSTF